jgi:Protein of unknown function (DUF551)
MTGGTNRMTEINIVGDGYYFTQAIGNTIHVKPNWIKCSDRLPLIGQHVLAYDTQRIYIAFRVPELDYNEHWKICDGDCCCNGPTGAITHWLSLPLLPEISK